MCIQIVTTEADFFYTNGLDAFVHIKDMNLNCKVAGIPLKNSMCRSIINLFLYAVKIKSRKRVIQGTMFNEIH